MTKLNSPSTIPTFPYKDRDQYYRVLSGILAVQICTGVRNPEVVWEVQERLYHLFAGTPMPKAALRVDITGLSSSEVTRIENLAAYFREKNAS